MIFYHSTIIQIDYPAIRLPDNTNKPGLTLVELLVAMTIFSILITLTLSIFFTIHNAQRRLEKRYEVNREISSVLKEIEISLKSAQRLVSGTPMQIKFLDANNDTIEYYLKKDTLIKNDRPLTNLLIDSFSFAFVGIKGKDETMDFYLLDENHDRILNNLELESVCGIAISLKISYFEGYRRVKIRKNSFITLRNLKS